MIKSLRRVSAPRSPVGLLFGLWSESIQNDDEFRSATRPTFYAFTTIQQFTYLFIYYYSTEGPKATYTVGKSTRSEKHM